MAIRPLSAELQAIAREELNEDPARLEQDLKYLREWLAKQPHLIPRTDSQWLITFLRGCKFSLERTKSKIEMFYTLRTALPEFFTNRDPMLPEIQNVLKSG
ncbi:retinol-binding protein pinta-like, partial [Zootermopsis nevadensis]|uniref:retinol-binding protein pinta-like n=1 Tax=Zootermopsis nevadensis TaxID=136037 RepID=UPI000B8ECD13